MASKLSIFAIYKKCPDIRAKTMWKTRTYEQMPTLVETGTSEACREYNSVCLELR
jgi:hypothetical protein